MMGLHASSGAWLPIWLLGVPLVIGIIEMIRVRTELYRIRGSRPATDAPVPGR